jgi:hypothetical protein
VKPEDIERLLIDDAAGVTASPRFSTAVMAAVRREADARPPIPFPWARAWPGIAAATLALVVPWLPVQNLDEPSGAGPLLGVSTWVETVSASVDPLWFAVAIAVVALTVVPVAAPFWLVSAARDS